MIKVLCLSFLTLQYTHKVTIDSGIFYLDDTSIFSLFNMPLAHALRCGPVGDLVAGEVYTKKKIKEETSR